MFAFCVYEIIDKNRYLGNIYFLGLIIPNGYCSFLLYLPHFLHIDKAFPIMFCFTFLHKVCFPHLINIFDPV